MENKEQNGELTIDLQRLLGVLLGKAWLIALSGVLCAAIVFAYTFFFIQPQYQSKAKFYVNNSSVSSSIGDMVSSITSADISASRGLVKTYIAILKTRETLNDVIDYAGVSRTYGQLSNMISAQAVDATEIFEVVVTSPDPAEAEKIANAIAYILPNRIKSIIDGTSAKVVEAAVVAKSPSSPNYTRNTVIGLLVGLAAMAAILIIRDQMDITIRDEEAIAQTCRKPILSVVPDMEHTTKRSGYYGYGRKSAGKAGTPGDSPQKLVGDSISFAASEAYKLLRTKLQFSFVDEAGCRVIGISSALTGEGKSLTAVNLAYTLSQLGKRVLLVDCDMRRPSMAEKLPVKNAPGLSDFLTGQVGKDDLFQPCGLINNERAFQVIAAGRTPPNPMELLSSARMEQMVTALRAGCDYVILDLPPVCEVGDPLAAAKLTDGMLLVVRQNYCDRISLGATVSQFEFVGAKILGVVFNCAVESENQYSKRYYRKYYKKYYQRGTILTPKR